MDTKKLTQVLLIIGGLVTVAAFIWWAQFYGQIAKEMGGNLGDAFGCLYSSSGPCGFISGLAQFGGVTPYSPVVFWIGIVMLGIGIILKLSLKNESVSSSSPRPAGQAVGNSTNKELEELRRTAGEDAVNFASSTETEWMCVCETKNPVKLRNCSRCHRNRDFALEHYRPPGSL